MSHLYNDIWNSKHLKYIGSANEIKYDDWLIDFESIVNNVSHRVPY